MAVSVVVCIDPFDDTPPPTVEIPGVGALKGLKSLIDHAASPYELSATLISQASPILAPIIQVLRVIEIVLAIINTLKAVKSPTKIGRRIKALIKKLPSLTAFIPGLPYVRLVRDVIDLLASILHGFVSLINRWITELNLISNALFSQSVLLTDTELPDLTTCSKAHLNAAIGASINTIGDLASVGDIIVRLLEIVKSFIPGDIPKDIIDVFTRIGKIPAELAKMQTAINDAETPDEISAVIEGLRSLLITIDELADRLDSISATISTFLP
jgi:hypothetical protein